jgi:hypothetical protein
MFEQIRARLGRPTFYVAAGIALGALLAPSFGGGGAQAVTTYTRAVSCQGLNWLPTEDGTRYRSDGTLRWSNGSTDGNPGYYVCNVDLPHKAVVTRVRFTLLDEISDADLRNCGLVRAGLTTATAEYAQLMAAVGATEQVGIQRLTDTTINYATVDNTNYAYYLQCQFFSFGNEHVGIYGADITYKITAANG